LRDDEITDGELVGCGLDGAAVIGLNLLPRLTGRVLKDVEQV